MSLDRDANMCLSMVYTVLLEHGKIQEPGVPEVSSRLSKAKHNDHSDFKYECV